MEPGDDRLNGAMKGHECCVWNLKDFQYCDLKRFEMPAEIQYSEGLQEGESRS
jgi:hypothetical protein